MDDKNYRQVTMDTKQETRGLHKKQLVDNTYAETNSCNEELVVTMNAKQDTCEIQHNGEETLMDDTFAEKSSCNEKLMVVMNAKQGTCEIQHNSEKKEDTCAILHNDEQKEDTCDIQHNDEQKEDTCDIQHNSEQKEKLMVNIEENPCNEHLSGRETVNTVVMSLSFLCVFTSYMAIQGLQGSLNDEDGLGVISLSFLYGTNMFSCIIAPFVVSYFPIKRIILFSFTAHIVYTACNFYPSFYTLIPSSIFLGGITGLLWTSQGIYLSSCAFSLARNSGIAEYAALSQTQGIFWALFDLANIIGNCVSSLVLYQGKYDVDTANRSEFCGINDCPGRETEDLIADPEDWVVYILLGIFLGCVLVGTAVILLFLTPIQTPGTTDKPSVSNIVMPLFKMTYKTDMKLLIPLTMYIAISEEICYAEITKAYVSCPIGIQNVGYVLMAYGLASSISGTIFSRLAKCIERYILLTLAALIHMPLLLWLYHWVPTQGDTVFIYVLITMWGLGDGLWKTQYNAFLAKYFVDDLKCVFAACEGIKAVGYTASFIYSSLLCMRVKIPIAITLLGVGMALYLFIEVRFHIRKKRKTLETQL